MEPGTEVDHAVASAARLGVGALAPAQAASEPFDDDQHRYINRELSTLDFNRRVLALAASASQPLLERLKYLAIFSSNTDEFFQVRVAGLKDQQAAGVLGTAPDGLSVNDQLRAIRKEVEALFEWRRRILDEVLPELAERGVRILSWADLDGADRVWLEKVFEERIFPVLTPLAVDPGHPFPYISNLSLNLAVIVRDPEAGQRRFARLKVPPLLPGFLAMPDGERFVPLEQVIAAHLAALFPGMEIESHHPFRVTRNADLTLEEDEADDLLSAVEMELRRRRFGRAVRLEVDHTVTEEVRTLLTRELDLAAEDVYDVVGPLEFGGLWAVHDLDRPELKDEPFLPVVPPALAQTADDDPVDVFAAIRREDILVHHPYDSFASSVEAFITEASRDPKVLAIKQTLYRTSGDSPVVQALIRAAERGKQVAALVELKARGDEAANIGWARALEQAGVHVVYGLVGLKTHSKTALVVRQEGDGIRRYCHIGTGNYNSITARLYEDLGILTADPALGADLTDLFNYLTGYSRRVEYRELMVAPVDLRGRILELVAREAALGERGRIIWKLNNLVDRAVIDALYAASGAGVRIDLITRAICCLRPGVPGLSDNIRVRGLVGRWLEHSRIYFFGAGDPDPGPPIELLEGYQPFPPQVPRGGEYYIGSADMMERNLDRRVEAIVPVPRELRPRLREILEVELADDVLAWELQGDGTWTKVAIRPDRTLDAHRWFQDAARQRDPRRREGPAPAGSR
jgi:polyphosphate kinase